MRCATLSERHGLSSRETDVLDLLARGKTTRQIEDLLFLSRNTVKTHVRHIYTKLEVHSRVELETVLYGKALKKQKRRH